MNKNFRVVTINGVRGVIAAIFVVMGLFAGFVISPGYVCMKAWNYFAQDSFTVSSMNIYQGILAWAIIALALYALNNKKSLIGIGSYQGISPEQMKDIVDRARDNETEFIKEIEERIKELQKAQGEKMNSSAESIEIENNEAQTEEIRR